MKLRVEIQRTYTRYETAPGEQAQFDWSPYTVLIAGRLIRIFVYVYLNGFSRYRVYEASLSDNQGAVLEAFESGIIASGGVPRRVQVDNASRSNFESVPDLLSKLKTFQVQVNARPHATIKTTPEQLIAKDRENFSPLPETRYVGVKEETRKVTSDCLLSYAGSRYSVPWPFAGKHVWVRLSKGYYLEVYSQANALLAVHTLSLKKGAIILDKLHYRTPRSALAGIERLKILFRESFPAHEMFLQKLLAQKRFNARYNLHEILQLARLYHKSDFEHALAVALDYNIFAVSFLAGYLEKNFKQTFDLTSHPTTDQVLPTGENLTRNLVEYRLSQNSDPF